MILTEFAFPLPNAVVSIDAPGNKLRTVYCFQFDEITVYCIFIIDSALHQLWCILIIGKTCLIETFHIILWIIIHFEF
jgi:hypothetical protein